MSAVIDMPTAKYVYYLFLYENTKYAGFTDARYYAWHYSRIIILYLEQTLVLHNVSNIVRALRCVFCILWLYPPSRHSLSLSSTQWRGEWRLEHEPTRNNVRGLVWESLYLVPSNMIVLWSWNARNMLSDKIKKEWLEITPSWNYWIQKEMKSPWLALIFWSCQRNKCQQAVNAKGFHKVSQPRILKDYRSYSWKC